MLELTQRLLSDCGADGLLTLQTPLSRRQPRTPRAATTATTRVGGFLFSPVHSPSIRLRCLQERSLMLLQVEATEATRRGITTERGSLGSTDTGNAMIARTGIASETTTIVIGTGAGTGIGKGRGRGGTTVIGSEDMSGTKTGRDAGAGRMMISVLSRWADPAAGVGDGAIAIGDLDMMRNLLRRL